MMVRARAAVFALLLPPVALWSQAPAPVSYRLSFPQPEHRWMQVEATFSRVPSGALELRMSRSSPGRYSLHQFAKNVYDLQVTDAAGRPLAVTHPNPDQWNASGHSGTVRVSYKVFGDRTDGTYLSVDSTHAHINMPSAIMWARGFELQPITIKFEPPANSMWRVGTQLLPGPDATTFTAPNLQYLMDSPTEVSDFALRTFTVPGFAPTFRIVLHHTGSDQELDAFARDVQRIVAEERYVFGEYPAYDNNSYTFLADYLPWANGDGMEHRNSTILTNTGSLRANRIDLLGTVAHEFFHSWNVERIRPRSLEPFNLDDVNMSGELWLAEGFTEYYGELAMARAGLVHPGEFAQTLGGAVDAVTVSPGRGVHSAEEMSQLAPFWDAATAIDRTNFTNTFISYYTFGEALALGLDLTLRDRSDGTVTLDHYMRALWQAFGKPGGRMMGYVDRPYTMADLESTLAAVSGDAAFASDFFTRFVRGHEVINYQRLLDGVGLVLRPRARGQAFAGDLRMQDNQGRLRISAAVPFGSPAYDAGLERDDLIVSIGGAAMQSIEQVDRAIRARRPGEALQVVFERRGQRVAGTLRLIEDPHVEVVLVEDAGGSPTAGQRRARERWLNSGARIAF
jgi:predicted metalloprotease with PDZ domain